MQCIFNITRNRIILYLKLLSNSLLCTLAIKLCTCTRALFVILKSINKKLNSHLYVTSVMYTYICYLSLHIIIGKHTHVHALKYD